MFLNIEDKTLEIFAVMKNFILLDLCEILNVTLLNKLIGDDKKRYKIEIQLSRVTIRDFTFLCADI